MSPLRREVAYDPTGVFPPAIKALLIANAGVFVVDVLLRGLLGISLVGLLGLTPAWVIERGWVWQPLTYMFVHGGFFHLLFNMFVLWMFGGELERLWGSPEFVRYYLLCGLGAAALSFVGFYDRTVVGASGAVYGILIAFGMLFPNRYIFLWFLIPVKAKYLVGGLAAIEILSGISGGGDGVAHLAHVGGMVVGFVYLRWWRGGNPAARLMSRWRRRHLGVVQGGAGRGPKVREVEIDRILDKISEHGLSSLTPEEERILDEASRRPDRD
jgi:membrane associated rhomboid family serine protease